MAVGKELIYENALDCESSVNGFVLEGEAVMTTGTPAAGKPFRPVADTKGLLCFVVPPGVPF